MNTKNSKIVNTRDLSLDIARSLGTMLIILAHVGAPTIVNEIRCFDVVLLVFVSGYCIRINDYGKYLWKRFKRLVVPAWVLLIVLFCATWIACLIVGKEQIYSTTKILRSFFFLNGAIGFIWIVRIYFWIAVLTPIIVWVNKIITSDLMLLLVATLFIVLNSLIARKYAIDNTGFAYYAFEIMAYSIIALIGYRYKQIKIASENDKPDSFRFCLYLMIISVAFSIVITYLVGFHPNEYKYPPTEPYMFYGLLATSLVFLILNQFYIKKITIFGKAICEFSIRSYDIYLIHILVLSVLDLIEELTKNTIDWRLKYIAVLVLSLTGTIILDWIKIFVKKKYVRM